MDKVKNNSNTALKEIVDNFVFKGRIPQQYQGDKAKIQAVANSYQKKLITPTVVNQVIGDIAFREVLDKVKYDDEKYKGETVLGGITEVDTEQITFKANEVLSSLPLTYHFLLRLPKCEKVIPSIKYAYNIELISANLELIKKYCGEPKSEKGLRSLLSDYQAGRKSINENDLLLKVTGKGYVGEYGTIKLDIIDPLYIFKVILGVYTALDILKPQDAHNYLRLFPEYTYDVHLENGEHIRSLSESTDDNQYITRRQFNSEMFEPTKLDKLLNKTSTPFDYANEVLTNLFSTILFAGDKPDKNVIKQQRTIKNGAYWFYESLKTTQDHVRAIYMTTAFDSLLAAKGNDDTKEQKAEIITISISKDSLEAGGIRKALIELYALRNEIVHGSREISSLEQYGEWEERPTQTNIFYCLTLLSHFLRSRIYFVNSGLAKVIPYTKRV